MLYLVGLGLGDEEDITVKGLRLVRSCSKVFLESYTSVLGVNRQRLEQFYGCQIIEADRDTVESNIELVLEPARSESVAFLVVGDVFGATTHSDLILRAKALGIQVQVVHNASIMNAIGACGLQLYHFGETITIPFFTANWRPDSFYVRIKDNLTRGQHTLCLLDIKVKEQSEENLLRGRKIYEPPRFMTINQALEQLLEIEAKHNENVVTTNTFCIGCARIGRDDQLIVSGTAAELIRVDFGGPLHSLVIAGQMHPLEAEYAATFAVRAEQQTLPAGHTEQESE